MAWVNVTSPTTGTPVSTTTFGIPVAGNMAVLGNAWTSYTPAWTSSGTAPALGNGTLVGRYLAAGKLIHFSILLTMGSTTTFGTGTYFLSLPVAAQASVGTINAGVWLNDNSASLNNAGTVNLSTSSVVRLLSATAIVTSVAPWTWANLDIIALNGTYEAA